MTKNRIRHIVGISGGKDSTALGILLHKRIPNIEFFFCDTLKELPETYEYLRRIEARLGIKIRRLRAKKSFDDWLDVHGGYLPSPRARWCTRQLKIYPLEEFVGDDIAYSYIGIRADENRGGYFSTKTNIRPVYPYKEKKFEIHDLVGKLTYSQLDTGKEFRKMGIELPIKDGGYNISDVRGIIDNSGIGMPKYYSWRSRSGCFFCFFQRKHEWVMLAEKHPDLFEEAVKYEKHSDGRTFTWIEGMSLNELRNSENIKNIKREYKARQDRLRRDRKDKRLVEVFGETESCDEPKACLICQL